jgi:hypothetical protein
MCESLLKYHGYIIYLCQEIWYQPRYRFCVFMCISSSWGHGGHDGVRWGVRCGGGGGGGGFGMGVGKKKK